MSDLDYEHISNLFAIVKGNAEHSGKFGAIQDYAMRELNDINDHLREKRMAEKEAELKREDQERADVASSQPKAIPSEQFDLSGKPVEDGDPRDMNGNPPNDANTTLVDRRI